MGVNADAICDARLEARNALKTLLVARLIRADGREAPCRIRNLSSTGMMIETACPLSPDMAISIELRGARFAGSIMWVRDGQAGLHFAAPIEVDHVLGEVRLAAGRQDQPRAPRFHIGRPARISRDGRLSDVLIEDLSQSGARLCMAEPPAPGSAFTLLIPGLPTLPCRTRWVETDCFGALFHGILPYYQLAEWLESEAAFGEQGAAHTASSGSDGDEALHQ